jgi:hypothetical protein
MPAPTPGITVVTDGAILTTPATGLLMEATTTLESDLLMPRLPPLLKHLLMPVPTPGITVVTDGAMATRDGVVITDTLTTGGSRFEPG